MIFLFYVQLQKLCKERGEKLTTIVNKLNLSTGGIARWKNGVIPTGEILIRFAEYFNVSTDYLLGLTEQKYNLVKNERNDTIMDMPKYLLDEVETFMQYVLEYVIYDIEHNDKPGEGKATNLEIVDKASMKTSLDMNKINLFLFKKDFSTITVEDFKKFACYSNMQRNDGFRNIDVNAMYYKILNKLAECGFYSKSDSYKLDKLDKLDIIEKGIEELKSIVNPPSNKDGNKAANE